MHYLPKKHPKLLMGLIALLTTIMLAFLIIQGVTLITIIATLSVGITLILSSAIFTKPDSRLKEAKTAQSVLLNPPSPLIDSIPYALSPSKNPVPMAINPESLQTKEALIILTLQKYILETLVFNSKFQTANKSLLIASLISILNASSPAIHYMFASRLVKRFLAALYKIMPQCETDIKKYHPTMSFEDEKNYALKAAQVLQRNLPTPASTQDLQQQLETIKAKLEEEAPVSSTRPKFH